jgi:predicted nucleic acid-binding protein
VKGCVVDASVALKWFVDEEFGRESRTLLKDRSELHTPELIMVEIANVLAKRVRRGQLRPESARQIRTRYGRVAMIRHNMTHLLDPAFELSLATAAGVHDCVYLALAMLLDLPLATADKRFINALKGSPYRKSVIFVADLVS